MDENIDLEKIEENLRCPITLERFKEPVIIPDCGHTVDRPSLIKMLNRRCPLCNCSFTSNPIDFKYNWTIVSMLNIDIKNNDGLNHSIMLYDANKAKHNKDIYLNSKKDELLKNILAHINNLSIQGKTKLSLSLSGIEVNVLELVKQSLIKKGFKLIDFPWCFEISWT